VQSQLLNEIFVKFFVSILLSNISDSFSDILNFLGFLGSEFIAKFKLLLLLFCSEALKLVFSSNK
jgi:hypothetical protein